MSASTKKKLRSEKASAELTEKQTAELKEVKKVRLYTVLTVVVLALMILTVIVVTVMNSGILYRGTTAATANGEKINAVEFNYAYIDEINTFVNQSGDYLPLMGLDPTKPLDSQFVDEEKGTTWADTFIQRAQGSLQRTYALLAAAEAENYTLTEADEKLMGDIRQSLEEESLMGRFPSNDAFLKAVFGNGASEKSYMEYREKTVLADSFIRNHQEGLEYTDADYREAEKDSYNHYSSYSYNVYYLGTSSFLKGGTKDEEGNTTYSEEEKAAAVKDAEACFKPFANVKSLEEFDAVIAAMEINKDKEDVKSTAYDDVLYGSNQMSSTIMDWLADESRQEGDVTYLPSTTTNADETKTTNGFYAVYFRGVNDNTMPLVNVRHILVGFEGGTKDEQGNTTYSEEEKAAAKAEAEQILKDWQADKASEESFAELAKEKTDDPGSKETGGLYQNVAPKTMVPEFDAWCFDASRKTGDTGIVETTYGYHVMFFAGNSDLTYRDSLIANELMREDMDTWFQDVLSKVTVEVQNTSKVRKNLILQQQA